MNTVELFFILFLYYGGIESVAEISIAADLKRVLKISTAVSSSVFISGILYYIFVKNIPVELKFMALPLTFMLSAYGVSRLLSVNPRKILFSSLAGILIILLPENPSGFFFGLISGCIGFFLAAVVLYRIGGGKKGDVFANMPPVIISISIISLLIELLRNR